MTIPMDLVEAFAAGDDFSGQVAADWLEERGQVEQAALIRRVLLARARGASLLLTRELRELFLTCSARVRRLVWQALAEVYLADWEAATPPF